MQVVETGSNAGLAFGGSPTGTASDDKTEEYNGIGWTKVEVDFKYC